MKIAIIGPAWPYRGGIAAFNERLAREFLKEGHEVDLFTFTVQYPKLLFPGKTQYSESPKPQDLKIERYINSVNPFNWLKVGRMLRKRSYDLVVVKYWLPLMAPCYGTVLRGLRRGAGRRTRVVSILDNVIPHECHFYDKWLTRYFIKSVDRFVAMSDSVERDLRLFTRDKPCTLCRHPLYDNFGALMTKEDAARKLGLNPNLNYFLFFGIIRDYKGLDWLLEAFADKRIDKSRTHLLVAGEFYSNREKYEALLRELQLESTVEWHTHFINDEDVAAYFSVSDFVVQPYKSATQSGVTQIAYHFGKPMLVTNVGGLAEIVPNGKAGYVVEPSVKAIADAMVDFCARGPECFASGIAEEKKKYEWGRMTEALRGRSGFGVQNECDK